MGKMGFWVATAGILSGAVVAYLLFGAGLLTGTIGGMVGCGLAHVAHLAFNRLRRGVQN